MEVVDELQSEFGCVSSRRHFKVDLGTARHTLMDPGLRLVRCTPNWEYDSCREV